MEETSSSMGFFETTFLNLFNAAQVAFDQKKQREFDANEAKKEQSLAPKIDGVYQISDEDINLHFDQSSTHELVPPKIFISPRREAILHACWVYKASKPTPQLVLWTDASVWPRSANYAFALWQHGSWKWIAHSSTTPHQTSEYAELRAIDYALEFAVNDASLGRSSEVSLFTDSQNALQIISKSLSSTRWKTGWNETGVHLIATVLRRIQTLEQAGLRLELHWVPRGLVDGNIVADSAARQGHDRPSFTSTSYSDRLPHDPVPSSDRVSKRSLAARKNRWEHRLAALFVEDMYAKPSRATESALWKLSKRPRSTTPTAVPGTATSLS
ncbi:hypothetical protein G7046_g2378 [Stylonectria norvegica]|nr:hypothetical protein G7046_g2378 [Stylonectria norvegica]